MADSLSPLVTVFKAWPMIAACPELYFGAVAAAWGIGWVVIYFLLRNQIRTAESAARNSKSETALADRASDSWKAKYEMERDQHAALKDEFVKIRSMSELQALELQRGRPEVRQLANDLDIGRKVETPVDPLGAPNEWDATIELTPALLNKIAAINYTSGNGLSQVVRTEHGQYETSATTSMYLAMRIIERSEKKGDGSAE